MKKILVLMVLSALTFIACKEPEKPKDPPAEIGNVLTLNFEHLAPITGGYYAVWIDVKKDKKDTLVLAGTFSVSPPASDPMARNEIAVTQEIKKWTTNDTLKNVTKCLISVEKESGSLPTTPSSVLLSGSVDAKTGTVSLTMDGADAFGQGFIEKMKAFKPSALVRGYTASIDENSSAGVWFVKPDGTSGLVGLPALPKNGKWKYEGWLVKNGHPAMIDSLTKLLRSKTQPSFVPLPISTGKFTSANGADEDENKYKGTGTTDAPLFPGGDFIAGTNPSIVLPTSVAYADAVSISIEPTDGDGIESFLTPFGLLNMQTYAHNIEAFRYRGAAAFGSQPRNTVLSGMYTLGIPTSGQYLPRGTASLKKK